MRHCHGRSSLAALLSLGLGCGNTTPGVAAAYRGFYTGKILPYPKEAEYDSETWELFNVKTGRARAVILVGEDAPSAEKLAAQDIADRIGYLARNKTIPILPPTQCSSNVAVRIAIGGAAKNRSGDAVQIPDKPEGYVILTQRHRNKGRAVRECLLQGHDPLGTYWAAQSLVQLIERQGDRIVLHRAKVRDWPTYRLRSFKIGGAFAGKNSPDDMGRWAPSAKFNCYNLCYTTMGQDKWKKPEAEFVAWVKQITRYLGARGIDCMMFVNPYCLWKEHIVTSNPADLEALAKTCSLGLEAGATRVMLCLDDFASEPVNEGDRLYRVRSEKDRANFGDDLGKVNVVMINDLYSRLRQRFPDAKLYVVPPYYWNPAGRYKAGGERDLQTIGWGVDPGVRFVWTGPQVRSAVLTQSQTEYYQRLVQRKVMLWDNTIYMRHSPPHFFLDDFVTRYPASFWELASGEVHLNAGGGEAYKAGLLAAATLFWNPEGYEAKTVMRDAAAAVAGPENIDTLMEFRNAFYQVYDEYTQWLGTPQELTQKVKQLTSRPFDGETVLEITGKLDKLHALSARLLHECRNSDLVAEVAELCSRYEGYRGALELVQKLPPPPEGEVRNIAPNPSAEEGETNLVGQWQLYKGAGDGTLERVEDPHSGRYAAKLTATRWHDWGDGGLSLSPSRRSINVAAMVGPTNGFTGEKAPGIEPLTKYHVRLYLKGDAPRIVISFVTWSDKTDSAGRAFARLKLEPLHPSDEWKEYRTGFVTPANAKRGALKIGLDGFESEGGGLGSVLIDDVYVGRSRQDSP